MNLALGLKDTPDLRDMCSPVSRLYRARWDYPLQTNDIYMRLECTLRIYMGVLILGVNTYYIFRPLYLCSALLGIRPVYRWCSPI